MNKKEVLEIRRLLKPDDCRVTRICGCYVDGRKEKILEMKEAFLSLPEEELHKYTELLKKTLSGQVGKNLLNLEFPLAEEAEGGRQAKLLALRDSALEDEVLVHAFFDDVIRTYLYAENYMILLVHGTYDIPGRASDKEEMFDASEYVYPFLICCICPVSLDRPGLCYDAAANSFVDKIQEWMIQNPAVGFLFPAFTDRNSDIHSLLYYTKDSEDLHPEITEDLLGCTLPLPAGSQKDTFNTIIEDTFRDECSFEVAKTVHENLNALLEGKKEEPQPVPLAKAEIRRFLSECGADPSQLEHFENSFSEDPADEPVLLASNLASPKKFEVRSDNVKISIASARTDLIETRMIDGQEYILIPVTDNVEVNGIRIRTGRSPEEGF